MPPELHSHSLEKHNVQHVQSDSMQHSKGSLHVVTVTQDQLHLTTTLSHAHHVHLGQHKHNKDKLHVSTVQQAQSQLWVAAPYVWHVQLVASQTTLVCPLARNVVLVSSKPSLHNLHVRCVHSVLHPHPSVLCPVLLVLLVHIKT